MDVISKMQGLINEAKKGIQFKRMNAFEKVIIILGLLPIIACTLVVMLLLYMTNFFYKIFLTPLEKLHNVIKEERNEIKHATQFWLYVVSWPLIFTMYIYKASMSFALSVQWFILMIFAYLVTLGGVKWQPFLHEADYSVQEDYDLKPSKVGVAIFVTILTVLYLIQIVCVIGIRSTQIDMGYAAYVVNYYSNIAVLVMMFVINPLVFRKVKKADALQ